MGNPEHEIRYYTRGRGLLEFAGTGELRREDSDELLSSDTRWADIITTIKVSDGITGIGEGVFDRFNALETIMLSRTVETISATPELITTLKEKNVTIRSEYDTCAEEFAKANDLQVLHCDIPIAEDNNEKYHERDEITLRFHADSAPDILHDVYSTGSNASPPASGSGDFPACWDRTRRRDRRPSDSGSPYRCGWPRDTWSCPDRSWH